MLATGTLLGFCEAGPGTRPDIWAVVERVLDDGTVLLRFSGSTVLSYAPGVIQDGIATGLAETGPGYANEDRRTR